MKIDDSVALVQQEVYVGSLVGIRRRISSVMNGYRERRGVDSKPEAEKWFININGALGELAFAKLGHLYWPASVNANKNEPDVLPHFQVRTAFEPNSEPHLIVRQDDPEQFYYVLMLGGPVEFIYKGWISGSQARKSEWFMDKGNRNEPAWWVPQSALHD